MYSRISDTFQKTGKVTLQQLKKSRETTILHPLNPKCPDIELKKKNKY